MQLQSMRLILNGIGIVSGKKGCTLYLKFVFEIFEIYISEIFRYFLKMICITPYVEDLLNSNKIKISYSLQRNSAMRFSE